MATVIQESCKVGVKHNIYVCKGIELSVASVAENVSLLNSTDKLYAKIIIINIKKKMKK